MLKYLLLYKRNIYSRVYVYVRVVMKYPSFKCRDASMEIFEKFVSIVMKYFARNIIRLEKEEYYLMCVMYFITIKGKR